MGSKYDNKFTQDLHIRTEQNRTKKKKKKKKKLTKKMRLTETVWMWKIETLKY